MFLTFLLFFPREIYIYGIVLYIFVVVSCCKSCGCCCFLVEPHSPTPLLPSFVMLCWRGDKWLVALEILLPNIINCSTVKL